MSTFPNETSTTKVVTDATQTINELGRLEAAYAGISNSIKDVTGRTKADVAFRKKLKAEQTDMKRRIDELRLSLGAEAMSYTQLTRAAREVRLEMGRMIPTMEDYDDKMKALVLKEKEYKTAIEARKKTMALPDPEPPKPTKSWWGDAKQALSDKKGSLMSGLGGAAIAGGIAGVAVGFGAQIMDDIRQKAIDSLMRAAEKSAALASMAAITGLDVKKDAADLRYYGDSAEYMADKFNMRVPDVIEAMQKIGSIKPELLGAKEALAGLTEEAITLARADGKISIEDAAVALVGSLNQFDQGAEQSTRYMNVLAASAKAGGAEINEVAETFKTAGVVLAASNISFEESNALVQILAKRQIVGSEAGTALRNVFSKLSVANKELNPTIVGVNKALENLSKLTPQEMVKMFGEENLVAAKTLVDLRGELRGLTDEMTGTTEATDQAAKKMDNLDEDIKEMGRSWDSLFKINDEQAGAIRYIIQSLTAVLNLVKDLTSYKWDGNWIFNPTKIIADAMGQGQQRRYIADQKDKLVDARKKGGAEFYAGMKESNIDKFEGSTKADKQIAYAQKFLADARVVRARLQKEIAEAKKSDPAKADQLYVEFTKVSGSMSAANNEIRNLEKGKIVNAQRISKILEGQEKAEADKKEKARKREEAKAKKHNEDLAKQEIQNLNTIAENKIQAIEKEEERELWMRQLQYSKEIQEAVKQEGDKTELYKSLEERLQLDLQRIRKKYADERLKEELETAYRLTQATRDLQIHEAQNRVREAEAVLGNNKAVFNARYDLSVIAEQQQTDELDAYYAKEREKYKENKTALANVEAAYQKELRNIQRNGQSERLLLAQQFYRTERERQMADRQRKLSNDLRESELGGSARANLDARLALLDSQMQAELDATQHTEEQKNEIIRGYLLERDAMLRQYNREQAVGWLEIFQAGIQGIAQLSAMRFQNEETRSNDAKAREDKRLDDQLKKGSITQDQYNKLKEKSDERYEKKQRELRRRKAEAEKKAALFEAAIQIPLAILKALPNPFAVAVASIAGAAQLAVIAGTEIPEYAAGGPVGGKWGEGKIIRAGEKGTEWVMPHWQTMDPATRPTLEWLEERRLSGTKGYQGTPPPGSATPAGTDPLLLQTVARMSGVIAELSGKLDNIHTKIYTDQLDRHFETQQSIMDDANVK